MERCSVVQINNGEVETKLAPLLPNAVQEGSSKERCWNINSSNKKQGKPLANNNHLGHQPVPVSQSEDSRDLKSDTEYNKHLEVPALENDQFGSVSPVSIITTCESNWSLVPCRDESSESIHVIHGIEEGKSTQGQPQPFDWNEGNSSSDRKIGTLHNNVEETKCTKTCLEEVQSPYSINTSVKNDEVREFNSGEAETSLGMAKSFRADSFTFKQNSYTKLPSCEIPKVPGHITNDNTVDKVRSETLLEKIPVQEGIMEQSRKSSDGNNSNKKKFSNAPKSKLRLTLAKERKASTTLGIIMSAFIICWLPFFVLALVRPFLGNAQDIPNIISSLFLWLGYANSLFNPIIYATLNKDFRKPFQEILCLRCSSLNILMREEFYYSQYGPDTPNHSHVRCSVPNKDQPDSLPTERTRQDSFEEPMTESRF